MAELIPPFFGNGPKAEQYVFRALELNLPGPWVVWWSLAYPSTAAGGSGEGEIDFLCAHPLHGLVVIEVKGGEVACNQGQWFQSGRRLRLSPPEQATRNAHALRHFLSSALHLTPFPLPIAHALWFPFAHRPAQEALPLAGITLYAADLLQPEPALLRILRAVRCPCTQAPEPPAPVPDLLPRLRAILSPALEKSDFSWRQRKTLADAQLARLTREQAAAFDAFAQFPRLRIRGCAGSGKTLLALRRARQLAASGKRTLLLCFTLLLAEHLRALTADEPAIDTFAVHPFLCRLLHRTPTGEPSFWHTLAQDALPAARAFAKTCPYHTLIIDEGQDFSPPIWAAIQALLPPDRGLLIFYDPAQNIFQRDLSALPTFPWPDALLSVNCRNTRAVFDALRPYAPSAATLSPDVPPGLPLETYSATTRAGLRARLHALLQTLLTDRRIPPSDILLIGAHALEKMDLAPLLADFPGLRYFTYRKFKGLEAPILILLDLSDDDPLWNRAARYTAISRAVHQVILLRLSPESTPSP